MDSVNPRKQTRYVIITPVRDEAQHIEETIKCVTQQTIKPTEWVIVDDGSTDCTGEIIDRHAAANSWIRTLHRRDRGFRDADVGYFQVLFDGFRFLREKDWEFIVVLDGDLAFDPSYFEMCILEFYKDEKLGIGGGTLYHFTERGVIKVEPSPDFHVRGATKILRRACWDAIGGISAVPGWDTLVEIKALMAGWRVRSFPNLMVLHRRPTGASSGAWRDSVKNGRSDYFIGYHPVFMFLKCLRRIFKKPFLVNGVGHLYGFIRGYIDRRPQAADAALIRYVRRQQMRRLLLMDSTWK